MSNALSKPVIGISCCIDRGKRWRPGRDYTYVARAYATAVRSAGGEPILLTMDLSAQRACSICDGIILTGGDDLPTTRDGLVQLLGGAYSPNSPSLPEAANLGPASPSTASAADTAGTLEDLERTLWELQVIDIAAQTGTYLLGICFGMQLMNLHFGGTLYRDLRSEVAPAETGAKLQHGGLGETLLHALQRSGASTLLEYHPHRFDANSSHLQAVREVAPNFAVTAHAPDGIIEAIERERLFGVQWHPETHDADRVLPNFIRLVSGKQR